MHDGRITGIIDWTDSEIGDPALDLSWLLNGAPGFWPGSDATIGGIAGH